jgi:hypothetical protein
VTVAKLIRGLKKYHPGMEIVQGDVPIKAMRIWEMPDEISPEGRVYSKKLVVRLIRQDEKRA